MQSPQQNHAPTGRTHRAGIAVLGLIAVLLVIAWFVFSEQEPAGNRQPAVVADSVEKERLAVLPAPLTDEGRHSDLEEDHAPAPGALVARSARIRVDVWADGLVADPPIVSISNSDGSWRDIRRQVSLAPLEWRDLQPGRHRLEALNGGWELDDTAVDLADGEARTIGAMPRTMVRVRVRGARTARPEAAYSVGVESRWVGSAGTRRLGPTFDVADPEGCCRFIGLPERSAGQDLDAIRAEVSLPETDMTELTSDWLPAGELSLDKELPVLVPEPAIIGRITTLPAYGEARLYLLRSSCVPEVVSAYSFEMLDIDMPDRERDIVAQTASHEGEFEFRLAALPDEALHVCAVAGDYGVAAVADSGPIVVPPTGAPVRVDLFIPQGGSIHGTLHGSVGAHIARGPMPSSVLIATQALVARVMDPQLTLGPRRYRTMVLPTDGGGVEFSLSGLASGEYEVTVCLTPSQALGESAVAARRLVGRASVSPGQITELVLDTDEPSHGSTLCGSLRLPAGFTPARSSVAAWGHAEGTCENLLETEASAKGEFVLADLPPGPLTLGASSFDEPGHTAAVAVLTVASASCVTALTLDMSRPEVRFHRAGGWPKRFHVEPEAGLSDELAVLRDLDLSLSFDESGTATLFGLPPGEYVARFGDEDPIGFTVPSDTGIVTVEHP